MLPQRFAQQTLRRLAVQQPAHKLVAPTTAAIAQSNAFTAQRRHAAAQPLSSSKAYDEILVKQRLARPVAPHLSIYQPQITWYLSSLNRITGIALSGTFYLFGAAYLVAPLLGWHLETAVLAAAFAKWSVVSKVGLKAVLAFPFTFHCLNGVRHLTWDTASMISNTKVNQTGWAVVGLSILGALGLAFL